MQHYAVTLDYEPRNKRLDGDVTVAARATQDLDFLSGPYGPYAHDSVGGIVDWAPHVSSRSRRRRSPTTTSCRTS